MKLKFVRPFLVGLLCCGLSPADAINYKLLNAEIGHHAGQISKKAPKMKKGLKATLKMSLIDDDEPLDDEKTLSSRFHLLIKEAQPLCQEGSFGEFLRLCQEFFTSSIKQPKRQTVLCVLLEGVTQKISHMIKIHSYLNLMSSKPVDEQQQQEFNSYADSFRPQAFNPIKGH